MKATLLLVKNILAPPAAKASASAIDAAITLVIVNEDMDDIIRIMKSLEISGVLIDGVSERGNHE